MKQHRLVGQLLCATSALLQASCSTHQADPVAIRVRWAHDPETLDPLQSPNQLALEAVSLLHLSLLQVDLAQQQLQPALAEALPAVQLVGDSLTRLSYGIRPAAAWDNGRPVLASDVAFTLKLLFCPGLPNENARARYSFIKDFEPDGANPRHFTLVCQGQSVEHAHTSGEFYILSEATLDPRGQLRRFSLAELRNRSATAPPDSALLAMARRIAAPGRVRVSLRRSTNVIGRRASRRPGTPSPGSAGGSAVGRTPSRTAWPAPRRRSPRTPPGTR